MLTIDALNVHYGDIQAIYNFSLEVNPGEIVALVGPNGAGKTTIMNAINGSLKPSSGKIGINGSDLASMSAETRAKNLAVVPQARNLPEDFSVYTTVLIGRTWNLGWLGMPSEEDIEWVEWALETTGLKELAHRENRALSGGEQQRVLLARAVAQNSPILLLDEPTSHLDLKYQISILKQVRDLTRKKDLAVFMALHDLNLASMFSDRVVLLVGGKVIKEGKPKQVLTKDLIEFAYQTSVKMIEHPDLKSPLIIPDLE